MAFALHIYGSVRAEADDIGIRAGTWCCGRVCEWAYGGVCPNEFIVDNYANRLSLEKANRQSLIAHIDESLTWLADCRLIAMAIGLTQMGNHVAEAESASDFCRATWQSKLALTWVAAKAKLINGLTTAASNCKSFN